MDINVGKVLLDTAKKSNDRMSEAICLFQSFLNTEGVPDSAKYYLARNRLEEGCGLMDEVINEAKKFLGPQPEYASREIKEMRMERLRAFHVIVESQTLDGLEAELLADAYIKSFIEADEVVGFVHDSGNFPATGKRKNQNLKVRLIIDHLIALRKEALELQQKAGEKFQAK